MLRVGENEDVDGVSIFWDEARVRMNILPMTPDHVDAR